MNQFDESYHIAFHTNDNRHPRLTPTKGSGDVIFDGGEFSGAPLYFVNGYRDEDIAANRVEQIGDVLFNGTDLVISEKIKNHLEQFEVVNLQLYPAIYIDNNDKWHDSYWYLNFTEEWDCWDRKHSIYTPPEDPSDPYDYAEIEKYSLDSNILSGISEEERLIFKIGGASVSYVFVHQRIVKYVLENCKATLRFIKVGDFEQGMQYQV